MGAATIDTALLQDEVYDAPLSIAGDSLYIVSRRLRVGGGDSRYPVLRCMLLTHGGAQPARVK